MKEHLEDNVTKIARALKIDRKTVRKYKVETKLKR